MEKKKSLLNNMAYNTWYTMINMLFPIITMPYLSRVLGAEGIGKVNFSASIVSYFVIIASLGVPLYGIREIAHAKDNKEQLEKTFNEIFVINMISSCISIILYLILIQFSIFAENRILLYINGATLIFNIANIDWFYRGLEEYKYITIRSTLIKLVSLIAIFIFVRERNDFIIYTSISIIALNLNNLYNVIHSRKFVTYNFKNLNLKKHLKSIFVLVSVDLAVSIYINLDTTMLGLLSTQESVGYYSNSIKINKIIVTVVTSITTVLLPRLSYYVKNNMVEEFKATIDNAMKIITFIAIPATVGVYMLAGPIVRVFLGQEFLPAIEIIRILSLLIIILSIGNLFGTQILIPVGKERKLLISVICGAAINFSLNLILIPIFKGNGAAAASVIAELIVMIIQILFVKRYFKIKLFNDNLAKIVVSVGVMAFGLILIDRVFMLNDFLSILLKGITGFILYIGINVILKEETTFMIYNKIKFIVDRRKI